MKIHSVIFERWQGKPDVVDAEVLPNTASFEQFCKMTFVNWTPHYPSLRCTVLGFALLKKLYQTWAIPLPPDWPQLVNQGTILLKINSRCRVPYYWDKHRFYVFHSETAMELEMAGRDITVWAKMF